MLLQVKSPDLACFAKVTPTSHNGSKELLQLQKQKVDENVQKIWIDFQKASVFT